MYCLIKLTYNTINDPCFTGNKYEPNTSEPITQPLKTLDEVLLWKPDEDEFNVATIPLFERTGKETDKPCTLLCHDMMGGYQEDR